MARNIKLTSLGYRLVVVVVILHSGCAVTVDMSFQNLKTVPQTIETSVTNLILKYNDLYTLDGGSFNKFVELLELNVDFCGIYIIYSGAFAAQVKLIKLSMQYNHIRDMPLDFGPPVNSLVTVEAYEAFVGNYDLNPFYYSAFKPVKHLKLGGGPLLFTKAHIPNNMTKLTLQDMLKTFPDLSNFAQLETLNVCYHEVTLILDSHIQGLDSLTTLYLCAGKLNVLPRLSLLKNLVKLIGGANPLTEIPRNKIEGLDKLKTLSFSSCQIQVMPNISYLPSLQMVYLQKNRIHYILNGTLRGLPSLYLLDLGENMISQTDGLQHITLGRMFLNDNQLTVLPDLFDMQISILEIGNNPLVCNQSLCWLRMWPWFRSYTRIDSPMCRQPPDLNETIVMNIHPVVLKCYNGEYIYTYIYTKCLLLVSYICIGNIYLYSCVSGNSFVAKKKSTLPFHMKIVEVYIFEHCQD